MNFIIQRKRKYGFDFCADPSTCENYDVSTLKLVNKVIGDFELVKIATERTVRLFMSILMSRFAVEFAIVHSKEKPFAEDDSNHLHTEKPFSKTLF